MHSRTRQPSRPVRGYGFGGGLLQRLVGEQPIRWVGELRPAFRRNSVVSTSTAARSPKDARAEAMSATSVVSVSRIAGDLAQRALPRLATQIGDVVEAESYDGLTPVTMTL